MGLHCTNPTKESTALSQTVKLGAGRCAKFSMRPVAKEPLPFAT